MIRTEIFKRSNVKFNRTHLPTRIKLQLRSKPFILSSFPHRYRCRLVTSPLVHWKSIAGKERGCVNDCGGLRLTLLTKVWFIDDLTPVGQKKIKLSTWHSNFSVFFHSIVTFYLRLELVDRWTVVNIRLQRPRQMIDNIALRPAGWVTCGRPSVCSDASRSSLECGGRVLHR